MKQHGAKETNDFIYNGIWTAQEEIGNQNSSDLLQAFKNISLLYLNQKIKNIRVNSLSISSELVNMNQSHMMWKSGFCLTYGIKVKIQQKVCY